MADFRAPKLPDFHRVARFGPEYPQKLPSETSGDAVKTEHRIPGRPVICDHVSQGMTVMEIVSKRFWTEKRFLRLIKNRKKCISRARFFLKNIGGSWQLLGPYKQLYEKNQIFLISTQTLMHYTIRGLTVNYLQYMYVFAP